MPIAAEGDGENRALMTRQPGGSTIRLRVPDVNLRAVFTGSRQESSVWAVGQRLFLADAGGRPKGVDFLAGRGFDDPRASVESAAAMRAPSGLTAIA